jgi:ATP/maltotriose-dependent transcriptional regulator MalT
MTEEADTVEADQKSLVEPLSDRELEVLQLVSEGLSNREIAEKLIISTGTAKTHVHNLCGKLGVRNRTEAAMKAKELDLA